jgi:SAM-dependent methyltransferase
MVNMIASPELYQHKEQAYLKVRNREGRVYPDAVLRMLPEVPDGHTYAAEWKHRRKTFERLLTYLKQRFGGNKLSILDVGCGNGWMSYNLAQAGHDVCAVDLNLLELQQAARVFGSSGNQQWIYADVLQDEIPGAPFDVVVMAASYQYFAELDLLTNRLKKLLAPGGEIHIVDSMVYEPAQVDAASHRSLDYYTGLEAPEMAAYYFHHSNHALRQLGYKRRLSRNKFLSLLLPESSALQWWYCINK